MGFFPVGQLYAVVSPEACAGCPAVTQFFFVCL